MSIGMMVWAIIGILVCSLGIINDIAFDNKNLDLILMLLSIFNLIGTPLIFNLLQDYIDSKERRMIRSKTK